jgi:hypothetical protein
LPRTGSLRTGNRKTGNILIRLHINIVKPELLIITTTGVVIVMEVTAAAIAVIGAMTTGKVRKEIKVIATEEKPPIIRTTQEIDIKA